MRGGVVLVRGRAGERAADRLRRGLVIVEGDAGEHAGSGMVAGTLVVCGAAGALPGILMRRGTIVLGRPAELAPSFVVSGGGADLVFSSIAGAGRGRGQRGAAACVQAAGARYAGDMAVMGKGEVFVSDRLPAFLWLALRDAAVPAARIERRRAHSRIGFGFIQQVGRAAPIGSDRCWFRSLVS